MNLLHEVFGKLTFRRVIMLLLGSAILAFGLYNVHSLSNITEGGILGLTLLLDHWFSISPAWSGLIMNVLCFFLGWKTFGYDFIGASGVAAGGFSLFYWIFEQFPQVYPPIEDMPFLAAIVGALFVGIGVGICVRDGGAPSGDDALAMSLCEKMHWDIKWVYLVSDLIILGLSATYIPPLRLFYSLITVVASGQIISYVQKIPFVEKNQA